MEELNQLRNNQKSLQACEKKMSENEDKCLTNIQDLGDKCEEVSSFHCVLSSLIGTYDDVLSSPIGTKLKMNRAHLILYDAVTPILKEKLPQTFRPIR